MKIKYIIYILFVNALFGKALGDDDHDDEGHDDDDSDDDDEYGEVDENAISKCYLQGRTYDQGPFEHPSIPCKVCECCRGGIITCTKKFCPKPRCGLNKQVTADDPCCKKCKPECDDANCPPLDNCPESRIAYANDSCCPECGCEHYGEGVPAGKFGHHCRNCICNATSNTFSCDTHCPTNKLTCVDPEFDINCNLYCPGMSCRRGSEIIPQGKIKILGRKMCACSPNWYPRAFCAFKTPPLSKRLKLAVYEKCLQYPRIPYSVRID